MDIIFEILFTFFGDLILQLLFGLVAQGISKLLHVAKQDTTRKTLIYSFFGIVAGVISVALIPNHITPNIQIRTINLIITPLAIGGLMTLFGNIPEDQEFSNVRRDKFLPAYTFAFAMALIRFFFAK